MTRLLRGLVALAVVSVSSACGSTFPTGEQIEEELERQLRSVAGDWVGTGVGNDARLTLSMTQAGTAVNGQGTLGESAIAPTSQISIEGSYVRPRLELTISEFAWGGEVVTGTLSGDYTTVAGLLSTLELSSGGSIQVLLQEVSP